MFNLIVRWITYFSFILFRNLLDQHLRHLDTIDNILMFTLGHHIIIGINIKWNLKKFMFFAKTEKNNNFDSFIIWVVCLCSYVVLWEKVKDWLSYLHSCHIKCLTCCYFLWWSSFLRDVLVHTAIDISQTYTHVICLQDKTYLRQTRPRKVSKKSTYAKSKWDYVGGLK